jgi:hypothetical protein
VSDKPAFVLHPEAAHDITRRGFGASTIATSGYDADRLGDDVLAILETGLVSSRDTGAAGCLLFPGQGYSSTYESA